MNITDNNGQTINMIIEHNLSFGELKKQYCELIYKKIRIIWLFYPKEKSQKKMNLYIPWEFMKKLLFWLSMQIIINYFNFIIQIQKE